MLEQRISPILVVSCCMQMQCAMSKQKHVQCAVSQWHFRSLGLSPAVSPSLSVHSTAGHMTDAVLARCHRHHRVYLLLPPRPAVLSSPPTTFCRPGEGSCRPPPNKHPSLGPLAHLLTTSDDRSCSSAAVGRTPELNWFPSSLASILLSHPCRLLYFYPGSPLANNGAHGTATT